MRKGGELNPLYEVTKDNLLDDETFEHLLDLDDDLERTKFEVACRDIAAETRRTRSFEKLLKAHTASYLSSLAEDRGGSSMSFFMSPLPGLRCGDWEATDRGVYRIVYSAKDFEGKRVTACPHPIQPVERLVNVDTNKEKIKLAFLKDGAWKYVTVDRSVCANKSKIVDLSDMGIEVTSETAKDLVVFLSDVVALNQDVIPVSRSTSHLGWQDDRFIPYCTDVKFDGDMTFEPLYDSITAHGDYGKWVAFCAELRKNIYLRLQMASSFASPLLSPLGLLPFCLHLWGGTGSGKTVGMMVAMSVWGSPKLGGLVKTMNMTANSMGEYAAFLNNLPFAGDELQIIKDKWTSYDSLIMYLTEGVRRGRLSGFSKIEEQKTWCNTFLFTGEEPITKQSSGGGVKNRVIEIEVGDGEVVIEDGKGTVNFILENYGGAGRVYIDYVSGLGRERLSERHKTLFAKIMSECDTEEKQAHAMAAMLLADELARECIFTEDKPLSVYDVRPFLKTTQDIDVAGRAYDWIINFVAANVNHFVRPEADTERVEIWGKIDDDYIMINKTVLSDKLKDAGFDYHAVVSKLAARGQVQRNTQGKFFHNTHVAGIKAMYVKIKNPDFDELDDADIDEVF